MESSVSSSFSKTSRALADKAAGKMQSGIRGAQEAAVEVGNAISSKLEDVRSEAGTVVNKGARRMDSTGQEGLNAISELVSRAHDAAANASDSIVAYTKNNPVKSLAIAAASGALLYAVIVALAPSRD